MANEAVLIKQVTVPISVTIADGTAIPKGSLLKLADPATFSLSSAVNDIVGGIAGVEKIASDGTTQLGVFRGPGDWFKVTASGAVTVGDPLGLVGDSVGNWVRSVRVISYLSGAQVIGTALETASDQETFKMELNIQHGMGSGT